jgi:hypothetical protein
VSDDGEGNPILNSDPVLWTFTDAVNGLRVLDAGCGTRATVGERRRRGLGTSVTIGNSSDASLHGNTGCVRGAAYLMPRSSALHLGRTQAVPIPPSAPMSCDTYSSKEAFP